MLVTWDREITIAYTAVGEIKDGTIKLTIPAEWSAPMSDYVTVEPAAAVGGVESGGDYKVDEDELVDELKDRNDEFEDDLDLGAMDIIVDGVAMEKGDTLTITYANAMVQPTKEDGVNFKVEVDGGDGPDTGPKEVTGDGDITHETTVDVEAARAGSGSGMVAHDPITTGATVETITLPTFRMEKSSPGRNSASLFPTLGHSQAKKLQRALKGRMPLSICAMTKMKARKYQLTV